VPENIERGIINPRLLKLSPRPERLNSTFLANLIQHPVTQRELLRMSHGGTMGILNAGQLRELRVITPPLTLQQKFAALVEQVERLCAVQREALRQAEHLFQTLLNHAFNGVL
jgi:type I restriction enzyme S subunit